MYGGWTSLLGFVERSAVEIEAAGRLLLARTRSLVAFRRARARARFPGAPASAVAVHLLATSVSEGRVG